MTAINLTHVISKPNPNLNLDLHPTTTNGWLYDLSLATAPWVDMLNGHPTAPQQLRQALEHVRTLAWNLHTEQEQEHTHEHDQLTLSTP